MPQITESRYMVMCGWDDVPHLDEKTKREILEATSSHLRDARSKGLPSLGAGAIYPVPESDIICDPFKIPAYWPRAYGLDVGWNKTAALWGAHDRETDTVYVYSEHYRGHAEPSVHVAAIKARGDWVPGVVDPAARGRSQHDGQQLIVSYRELGLRINPAENSVESGLDKVFQRLSTGRLKIFKNCGNTLAEYRIYRRDENGKIVKAHDHAMDALRYLIVSGISVAKVQPVAQRMQDSTSVISDMRAGY